MSGKKKKYDDDGWQYISTHNIKNGRLFLCFCVFRKSKKNEDEKKRNEKCTDGIEIPCAFLISWSKKRKKAGWLHGK